MLLKLSILCAVFGYSDSLNNNSNTNVSDNFSITINNITYTMKDLHEIHALICATDQLLLKHSSEIIDKIIDKSLNTEISTSDLVSYILFLSYLNGMKNKTPDIIILEDMFKPYSIKYNMRQKNFTIAAQLQFIRMQINQNKAQIPETLLKHNEAIADQQDEILDNSIYGYGISIIDLSNTPENIDLIQIIIDEFNNKTSTIAELCSKYSEHISKDSANGLGIYRVAYIPQEVRDTINAKRKEKKPFPCMHVSITDNGIRIYFITNKYSSSQIVSGKTFTDQLTNHPLLSNYHRQNHKISVDLK